MPIATTLNHVSRACDFFNKPLVFFGFGRQTPWPDEENPDPPSPEMENIEEPIGYKQAENKYMVVPDDGGTIAYRDGRWRIVPYDQAVSERSRWVYLECQVYYDELPLGTYRQIGVYTGLIKGADIPPGKTALAPEEVKDAGILEIVENRRRVTRQIDQKEYFSIIIEF